ncbi:hypothetical protein [Gelatiniphilus marinus]|uniref:Porin n=1 Tax=Gelatiniphilus marinus TaxID=1759464 RepID=A0ABW5JRQ8_9FLAO
MKKGFLMLMVLAVSLATFSTVEAQEATEKEKDFTVKWNGYVKGDYILDTRRLNDTREGQYIVIPLGEDLDANGDDRNAEFGYNSFAIESRLKASFTGPDFLGMKTAGVIEAHFFGANGADINSLGLRHAFFTLSNDKVEWLFGQYWHPTFVTNVSPGTHAFNAGVPYQPFNRSPQIRFSTKGNVRFTAALLTERDFTTASGRDDGYGGAAVRFAGIPTLHAQLQFGSDDNFVGGFGTTLKTVDLNDRLNGQLAENDNITSLSFMAYAKAQLSESVTWKVYGQYGGNTTEQLMFGGYGREANGDLLDSKVLSAWTEFSGKFNNELAWGLFAGYTKDGGFGEDNVSVITSSGVENSYRISPRLDYTVGKVRLGVELGYTTAQYASGIDANGGDLITTGIDEVGNFRSAFSATFFF